MCYLYMGASLDVLSVSSFSFVAFRGFRVSFGLLLVALVSLWAPPGGLLVLFGPSYTSFGGPCARYCDFRCLESILWGHFVSFYCFVMPTFAPLQDMSPFVLFKEVS